MLIVSPKNIRRVSNQTILQPTNVSMENVLLCKI